MLAIVKIIQSMGEKIKTPTDWIQIVKILTKREKKILAYIKEIPNNLKLINTDRVELMRFKSQCFGKGKIMLASISSSFQKEARVFANLFGLIIMTLQKMKKDQNLTDTSLVTPSKCAPSRIEERDNIESEGPMPKDSCDESNSYYYKNGSKYAASSSNDPTPDKPKPKKSPLRRSYKSPSKVVVKKGYLSSENRSVGSNKLADYNSPSAVKSKKHNPNAVKRTVDLRSKKKLAMFDSPKVRNTNTVNKKPYVKKCMVSDSEVRLPHTQSYKTCKLIFMFYSS
jgi:hypothetical protein